MKLVYGLFLLAIYAPCLIHSQAVASSFASAVAANGFATATAMATAFSDVGIHCIHCQQCDLTFEPVCGSNGVTYSNECLMRCVGADHDKNGRAPVRMLHRGKCHTMACECQEILNPVCGTNNQTYPNDCVRNCVNEYHAKYNLAPVGLAYRGVCKSALCYCPDAVIPMCGTDGKTYRNICHLQCCARNNTAHGISTIFVRDRGACENETCNCALIEERVCASNGHTYYNKCALDCQNRKLEQLGQKPLTLLYNGECMKCVCSAEVDPVCGSDGKSYPNCCFLLCENRARKRQGLCDLTVRWWGPCNCGCGQQYKPVCGSDWNNWSNHCLLDCENRKRSITGEKLLTVLYEGECEQCDCEHCPTNHSPVCGSDHKTYQNSCFLKCNSNCRVENKKSSVQKIANRECCRM